MILRHFGAARIREVLREHIRLAREFADQVDGHPDFERVAPVPFSVVCFRRCASDDENAALLARVNASGEIFLSHTRLNGAFVIRMAIGHLRTTRQHTARAWELLCEHTAGLARAL